MDTNTRTRQHSRRLLTIVLAALIGASGLSPAAADEPLLVEGITSEQEALVGWAIGLYAEAGLELPNMRITGTDNPDSCDGRLGFALPRRRHVEITLCSDVHGAAVEFLLVHELAHAWDFHSLTDERRAAFQELRGANVWLERDVEWRDRAGEQAAEIMVWALMDRPIRSARIWDTSCEQLEAGYRTLTGLAPLHGYTDHC